MANNLRKIRLEQGLSQTELARRARVSRPVIIKIESSETIQPLKTTTLVKIADALNRSVAEIFFD